MNFCWDKGRVGEDNDDHLTPRPHPLIQFYLYPYYFQVRDITTTSLNFSISVNHLSISEVLVQ